MDIFDNFLNKEDFSDLNKISYDRIGNKEIKIYLPKGKLELLNDLNLPEYFITSKAEKFLSDKEEIKIEVKKASGKKCSRCWKILDKKCERASCPV